MKFSVWFYPSDETFHTRYEQFMVRDKPGFINGQGHILVATFYWFDNRPFFCVEDLENYIEKHIIRRATFKQKLIKQINAFLDKEKER